METFGGSQSDIALVLGSIDPSLIKMARSLGTRIRDEFLDDPNKQGQLFAEGMSQTLNRGPDQLFSPSSLHGKAPSGSLEAAKKLNDAAIVAQEMAEAAGIPEHKTFFEKFRESVRTAAMQIAAGDPYLEVEKEDDKKGPGAKSLQKELGTLHKATQSILSGEMPEGLTDDIGHKPRNFMDAVKIGATRAAVALMAGTDAEREYMEGLHQKFDKIDQVNGKAPSISAQIRSVSIQSKVEQGLEGDPNDPQQGPMQTSELTEMQKSPFKAALKRMMQNVRRELGMEGKEEQEKANPATAMQPPGFDEALNKSAAPPPPAALLGLAKSIGSQIPAQSLGTEDPGHLGNEHPSTSLSARGPQKPKDFDFSFFDKKSNS
jgi:hypothetical protein